ncbi:hypothetical protein [Pedobacter sp.]|uniref:hypothetical protein n=1 Tax=Pedobacter sp. TaxID=1411316 RepID=UPI003D7F386C
MIALVDMFVIKLGSLNLVGRPIVGTETESKLLLALSKQLEVNIDSYFAYTAIHEIVNYSDYIDNVTEFSPALTNNIVGVKTLCNEIITNSFVLDQLQLSLFGEAEFDIDNYTFLETCCEALIYYQNYSPVTGSSQIDFDINATFSKDAENVRTKSQQQINVLNNICSSLVSNDII